jgi:fumarate hydratase class II
VHPNDHVNRGQSSNDVIPAAIHIANRLEVKPLAESLRGLSKALAERAREFKDVIKIGRTHLQDAVPMTLGQEFTAYATQITKGLERLEASRSHLEELALGGTAIGTGLNAHPQMASRAIERIAAHTGIPFLPAASRFEAIASREAQVGLMGALNSIAVALMKIANDLRLLASGPRAGLGEIILPSLQPGSSIMPGKVNPVIPEMVIQVAAHVMGKNQAVTIGAQNGPLELNMMNPLIAYETLSSLSLLARTADALAEKCIAGIRADRKRCADWVEYSLALVTPLATRIGYDRAAALAYEAYKSQRSIRDVAREQKVLPEGELDQLLDPWSMI